MWVQSLGWEDPLEEEMATHSSILVENSQTEESGGLQSMESQRAGHDWAHTHTHTHTQIKNKNPSPWHFALAFVLYE